MDLDPLRILEIGEFCLFKTVLPNNTVWIWTGSNKRSLKGRNNYLRLGLRYLWYLMRSLRTRRFDLIVCYPPERAMWEHNRSALGNLYGLVSRVRDLAIYSLKQSTQTPLAVLDFSDSSRIERHNFFHYCPV